MRLFLDDGSGRRPLGSGSMSFQQSRQAIAIADCMGRMIPQEGIDFEVDVIFKGAYDPSVSMNIVAMTEKGEFWREYVMRMIAKYPPTMENPPMAIEEEPETSGSDSRSEVVDAEVVS